MTVSLGYLLPTRELCMAGVHETRTILALADRAEALGLDSVWIGDSLLAKPRHEPLSLLAAIAARTKKLKLGTAVPLAGAAQPGVARPPGGDHRPDQRGAVDPWPGHWRRRPGDSRGVRGCGCALRQARRPADGGLSPVSRTVDRGARQLGGAGP